MLTDENNKNKKYGGGFWCEGVCQKENKATEARHQGDCKCSATKFTTPKVGQKLKITGAYVVDNAEGGQAEIHPITSIEVMNSSANVAHFLETSARINQPQFATVDYNRIRISNLFR